MFDMNLIMQLGVGGALIYLFLNKMFAFLRNKNGNSVLTRLVHLETRLEVINSKVNEMIMDLKVLMNQQHIFFKKNKP